LLFVGAGEPSEDEVQNEPSKQNSASPPKPLPRKSIFTMLSSEDDSEVPNPPPTQKDQGPMRSRGRPRKTPVAVARSSVTSAATSRNEEIGTTGVDDSDAYDPAAAQPHGEVQSARQTLPRRPKSEFDQAFSEFRSSQILRGT